MWRGLFFSKLLEIETSKETAWKIFELLKSQDTREKTKEWAKAVYPKIEDVTTEEELIKALDLK